MKKICQNFFVLSLGLLLALFLAPPGFAQVSRTIDHTTADIHQIPANWIDSAKAKLDIVYWRASHGTHLTLGGMRALMNYSAANAELYNYDEHGGDGVLKLVEFQEDLEHQNDSWVATTEAYLATHPDVNVVMWAWCGIEGMDIDQYLADMEILIDKYGEGGSENRPVSVKFVFMNAHTWPYPDHGEEVYNSNKQIKTHSEANNRWFYDFYDVECFDPDENYFGDGTPERGDWNGEKRLRWDTSYDLDEGGRGNWGIEWMSANPGTELTALSQDNICQFCVHSNGEGGDDNSRLHCVLKGQAAWWLWARLAGWQENAVSSAIINALNIAGLEVLVWSNHITINTDGAPTWEEGRLRVLSLSGSEILNAPLKQGHNEIEIQQNPGIYILALQSGGESYYQKVFIQ